VPTAIIIAGPNGAGKTTFADRYLLIDERRFEFVNADEIARGSDARGIPSRSDVAAGRLMLRRVDELVKANANFALETTLATLTYARKIPVWRKKGVRRVSGVSTARLSRRLDQSGPQTNGRWRTWHPGRNDSPPIRKERPVLENRLQTAR
jgi:hypothetical protein